MIIVRWDDDVGRVRLVRRACENCDRFMRREYGRIISLTDPDIVSPAGVAHAQHDHDEGHTACGRDATGRDWWWSYGRRL